jgi:hypothetical protein
LPILHFEGDQTPFTPNLAPAANLLGLFFHDQTPLPAAVVCGTAREAEEDWGGSNYRNQ